jgi:hypothetical protein
MVHLHTWPPHVDVDIQASIRSVPTSAGKCNVVSGAQAALTKFQNPTQNCGPFFPCHFHQGNIFSPGALGYIRLVPLGDKVAQGRLIDMVYY